MPTVGDLAAHAGAEVVGDAGLVVNGIAHDSRDVRGGELFVALHGLHTDGAAYLSEAVARGAVALCIDRGSAAGLERLGVPLIPVDDPRAALAELSAAVFGHPARELQLVGITGTLGKTSTAALLQAALVPAADGRGVGVVGSLGAGIAGQDSSASHSRAALDLDGMTTPDAPDLHRAFRVLVDSGVRLAVMEVTSHALAQERVRGLEFQLGLFTNLVPDEHLDFHGTPDDYLQTKARFFDHLAEGAPVVFNADDRLVVRMVRERTAAGRHPLVGVSVHGPMDHAVSGDSRTSLTRVEDVHWDGGGSTFTVSFDEPLPRLGGGDLAPTSFFVSIPLLGVQLITNAALAATAALVAGASPSDIGTAFAGVSPVRRRMQVIWSRGPLVIDDTTGNPETLRAVFATAEALPRSRLRIVFGLRGSRGVEINQLLADTLAELVSDRARVESVQLVVTWSEDVAGERDVVTPEEREAALAALEAGLHADRRGLLVEREPSLSRAVDRALSDAEADELVLLLGTQGMDRAAEFAVTALRGRRAPPAGGRKRG
jgi:UDP-N-acetylmuramoyl-L-alanyl-D-glutamate--2,6-diaminopimelate ligase